MATYWFKPHRYGYDATPANWQGWAVSGVALAIVLLATAGLVHAGRDADFSAQAPWLLLVLVAVAVSVLVSRWKTEGGWRWRWGEQDEDAIR
jgi:hypothetical protein